MLYQANLYSIGFIQVVGALGEPCLEVHKLFPEVKRKLPHVGVQHLGIGAYAQFHQHPLGVRGVEYVVFLRLTGCCGRRDAGVIRGRDCPPGRGDKGGRPVLFLPNPPVMAPAPCRSSEPQRESAYGIKRAFPASSISLSANCFVAVASFAAFFGDILPPHM